MTEPHPLLHEMERAKQATMAHFGLFQDDQYCWVIPVRFAFEPSWRSMMETLYGKDYCQKHGYRAIHNIFGIRVFWSATVAGIWCTRWHPETIVNICQSVKPLTQEERDAVRFPHINDDQIMHLAANGDRMLEFISHTLMPPPMDGDDDEGEEWKKL